MMARRGLRAVALAIAVLALIDPAVSRQIEQSEPLTIVATSASALPRATALHDTFKSEGDVQLVLQDETSRAAACPDGGDCIIVASDNVPDRVTAGARVLAVARATAKSSTAPVTAIDGPLRAHAGATATLRVSADGPMQRVEVFDADTLVGSAAAEGQQQVDVQWVPIATGARALRVVVDGTDVAHAGVAVDPAAVPVLFYEPHPTWIGTFVRRALEDDARFAVRGRARIAPPVSVTRGDAGPLTASVVHDFGTVIVTAPESLTAAEIGILEQYVSVRGGSVIALSESPPRGAALRLLPRTIGERREPNPQSAGLLRVSEWLVFESGPGVTTVASVDKQPVVVVRALGRGRVIASGALDAWRFRQADEGFSSFWTTLAWDAAQLAGPRLRVVTDRVIARPGQRIEVLAELQDLTRDTTFTARGALRCDGSERFLRLWPAARPGTFRGSVTADAGAECEIAVTINGVEGAAPVTFRDDLEGLPAEDERLTALAAAFDAMLVTEENEGDLVRFVRDRRLESQTSLARHPMRSPWWLLPFALCLGGEWWLRRRAGLS